MWSWGIGTAAVLGMGHVAARYARVPHVAGILKAVPIALLGLLVAAEPNAVSDRYRVLVLAGLACSLAGDLWLLFPTRFVQGLASFLVAHLCYIAAFAPARPATGSTLVPLVPFAVVGVGMLAYLWPHLGRDRPAVLVYVAAIVVMGWRAALRAIAPTTPSPSDVLALAGAALFTASDGFLAVDRFARRFASADAAVMVTYYAAQTLIALSVRA
jgi:uncharacterized membrane protein YhhN